jgi:universal stress protein A
MVILRKILVTTDLSEHSLAAMEYASSLGLVFTSKMYLMHVVESLPLKHAHLPGTPSGKPKPVQRLEDAKRELEEFIEHKVRPDFAFVPIIRVGSPAEEIRRFAAEEKVDLIIMATHGHTGLKHILLGGVTEKVVRHSAVPVLTVKPRPLLETVLEDEDVESDLHLR